MLLDFKKLTTHPNNKKGQGAVHKCMPSPVCSKPSIQLQSFAPTHKLPSRSASTLADVHRLARDARDVLVDDEAPDGLLLDRGRPAAELVRALLLHALVRLHEVAEHLRVRGGDHARVDVRAGAEVVEDTRGDRGADEVERFCAL